MKLADAYQKLQWGEPLAYERSALGRGPTPAFPRGIGTSAHMLIELYLDMHKDQRNPLHAPAQFLVLCLSPDQARYLREWLNRIDLHLDLNVDLERVRFWPHDRDAERLRGHVWYSWAVFCDHAVKEVEGWEADRNTGPYGLVRRVVPSGENWRAFDRDGRFLGVLTNNGKNELIDRATCPITVEGPSTTTYAATDLSDILRLLRVREAFKR